MTPTDEVLVQVSRDGDRTASAGSVQQQRRHRTTDVVTAWSRKFDLTDPAKIAVWLFGITRNLVLNDPLTYRLASWKGFPGRSRRMGAIRNYVRYAEYLSRKITK